MDDCYRLSSWIRRKVCPAWAPMSQVGFVMTTLLGIVGAIVANILGQSLGWYRVGEGAGLIGAVVGAIMVLIIWGAIRAAEPTEP